MSSFFWEWFKDCLFCRDIKAQQNAKRLEIEAEIEAKEAHVDKLRQSIESLTRDRVAVVHRAVQRTREERAKRREPFDPVRDPVKPNRDEHRDLVQCSRQLKQTQATVRQYQKHIESLQSVLELGNAQEFDSGTQLSIEYMELSSRSVATDKQRQKMLAKKTALEQRLSNNHKSAVALVSSGDSARLDQLTAIAADEMMESQQLDEIEAALDGTEAPEVEHDPIGWHALYLEASAAPAASAVELDDDNA